MKEEHVVYVGGKRTATYTLCFNAIHFAEEQANLFPELDVLVTKTMEVWRHDGVKQVSTPET